MLTANKSNLRISSTSVLNAVRQHRLLGNRSSVHSFLNTVPWENVVSHLFKMDGKTYLLVVDYFSRYVKVQTLSTATSASIIKALKAVFPRHGIPSTLVSDNGPQYSPQEFANFSCEYNFTHTRSSQRCPQSNDLAERMVRTVRSLLSKSSDPYSALLAYRSTPLPWCGYSQAKLLMWRKILSKIPQHSSTFIPD